MNTPSQTTLNNLSPQITGDYETVTFQSPLENTEESLKTIISSIGTLGLNIFNTTPNTSEATTPSIKNNN